MPQVPRIVSFNDPYHDSSFCIFKNGEFTHVEVERLTRIKYDSINPIISFCERFPNEVDDFDVLVIEEADYLAPLVRDVLAGKIVPSRPEDMAKLITSAPAVPGREMREGQPLTDETLLRVQAFFQHVAKETTEAFFCGHHAAHAANSFFSSDLEHSLVITLDGGGFDYCVDDSGKRERREIYGGAFRYVGNSCTLIEHLSEFSFGLAWCRATDLLDLAWGEEGTVMAMAALGDPQRFQRMFSEPFFWMPNLIRMSESEQEATQYALARAREQICDDQDRYDFAAGLQFATETRVEQHLARLIDSDTTNLCVGGGLFLNCQLLGKIPRWFPQLKNIFIPPAPYDGGISIGAAQKFLYEKIGYEGTFKRTRIAPFAMGRHYTVPDILAACHAHGSSSAPVQLDEILGRIEAGQVIAVFAGAAESGRRALGHRSLIADPRHVCIKDRINSKIKHRQWFRPLAPIVLAEHATEWFDCPPGLISPYMSFAVPVQKERRATIPAIVHLDGSARFQTVHRELSPLTHALLSGWHVRTGIPVLINTSFNDHEPIVETPSDALATFRRVPIDALYFLDFGLLVTKPVDSSFTPAIAASGPVDRGPWRLDTLIEECASLRFEVLAAADNAPAPLVERFHRLFTDAANRTVNAPLAPYQDIYKGVRFGFQPTAQLFAAIEPKHDDAASPDSFLNTISLSFSGASAFFSLEAPVAWRDLSGVERFQLAIRAEPNRPVSCRAVLRIYNHSNGSLDLDLARFSFRQDTKNINRFGEIMLDGLIDIDPFQHPLLIIFFDTAGDLRLHIDYINVYFA
jgi:carbamoyltransferase